MVRVKVADLKKVISKNPIVNWTLVRAGVIYGSYVFAVFRWDAALGSKLDYRMRIYRITNDPEIDKHVELEECSFPELESKRYAKEEVSPEIVRIKKAFKH